MSASVLINNKGELEYSNITTQNLKVYSSSDTHTISVDTINVLLQRIEALERYVLAHQETYTIQNADGTVVRLTRAG